MRHAFKPDGTEKQRTARTRGAGSDGDDARHYHCAACTTRIARTDAAIEIAGAHRHRFANPAGVEFEIGCFAHLGWCYEGDGVRFFGLIVARLVGPI